VCVRARSRVCVRARARTRVCMCESMHTYICMRTCTDLRWITFSSIICSIAFLVS